MYSLRSAINVTLKKRFRNHPSYLKLHDMFDEASLRTELGQHCDLMATAKLLELDQLSWNQYEFITAQKFFFYTIYLPMAIPPVFLGLATAEKQDKVYKTYMLLGHVFQARDNFLDVNADPLVTGKVGTDIQENKCSWLLVWTLENCSDEQKKEFQRCYGSTNKDDVSRVKELFRDLNVSQNFLDWDKEMWTKIEVAVEELTDPALKELHTALLSKYNRDPRRRVAPSA
jgi:farnesyl diphosphate synthase